MNCASSSVSADLCASCVRWTCTHTSDIKIEAVDLAMDLPSWTDYKSASADEKRAWDAMIAALTAHEQHHLDIIKGFKGTVSISGTGSNCGKQAAKDAAGIDFDTKAEAETQRRRDQAQKDNDKYDNDTDHGATKGVTLPEI